MVLLLVALLTGMPGVCFDDRGDRALEPCENALLLKGEEEAKRADKCEVRLETCNALLAVRTPTVVAAQILPPVAPVAPEEEHRPPDVLSIGAAGVTGVGIGVLVAGGGSRSTLITGGIVTAAGAIVLLIIGATQ